MLSPRSDNCGLIKTSDKTLLDPLAEKGILVVKEVLFVALKRILLAIPFFTFGLPPSSSGQTGGLHQLRLYQT